MINNHSTIKSRMFKGSDEMLVLPIKKKWFDMILFGEKKEEYREIKSYWTKRFSKYFEIEERMLLKRVDDFFKIKQGKSFLLLAGGKTKNIKLRNGYSNASPYVIVKVTLLIGEGMVEYGAKINETYYCLKILDILEIGNIENPALKFEELKPNMKVWDKLSNRYIQIYKTAILEDMVIKKWIYIKENSLCMTWFEENRFYKICVIDNID